MKTGFGLVMHIILKISNHAYNLYFHARSSDCAWLRVTLYICIYNIIREIIWPNNITSLIMILKLSLNICTWIGHIFKIQYWNPTFFVMLFSSTRLLLHQISCFHIELNIYFIRFSNIRYTIRLPVLRWWSMIT